MTTTESQITSGKAESIKKLRELARKAQIDGWPFYGIAYQKASSPDVVLELIERAEKAEAERDHFKALIEANRAGKEYAELSDKELSDPEYMRAYVEGCQDGFATMLESRNHFKAIAERQVADYSPLFTRIDEAIENYVRHGAACEFEGQPMTYAATLLEIGNLLGGLAPNKTVAQLFDAEDVIHIKRKLDEVTYGVEHGLINANGAVVQLGSIIKKFININ